MLIVFECNSLSVTKVKERKLTFGSLYNDNDLGQYVWVFVIYAVILLKPTFNATCGNWRSVIVMSFEVEVTFLNFALYNV